MTYLEKFIQDHADWDDRAIRHHIDVECPIGPDEKCPDGFKPLVNCYQCWIREIPETENNEREEKKMEATTTTRKTKAELLKEIADLKKQLDHAAKYEAFEECANEMAAMCRSFENAGFSRAEAMDITKLMISLGAKMPKR